MKRLLLFILLFALLAIPAPLHAGELANIKVVTDATPDFSDMESLVHSATANWKTDQEKMWALFYWNHIARRYSWQPMHLHGDEITDPIRQYNDFGYANFATVAGIQCSLWNYMGYRSRYYGSASEVFYDGKFHLYDNTFSCIYSLSDGKTVAAIDDIAKPGAGPETDGKTVPNYIALYHALNGTSPNGYLQGADVDRTLASRADAFVGPYPYNFYNQERAHRYILNLRDGESYTRYYSRQDTHSPHSVVWNPVTSSFKSDPAYFVPNGLDELANPSDPEALIASCRVRGNGERTFAPILDDAHLPWALHDASNIKCLDTGLQPLAPNRPAVAIFKVEGANIITSLKIHALLQLASAADSATLAVSTTNGAQWTEIWRSDKTVPPQLGETSLDLRLIEEVSGSYEILIKVTLTAKTLPENARLKSIAFNAITQLNSKSQPQLHIGLNTIYVGLGEQSQSIVLAPGLHKLGDPRIVEQKNLRIPPNDLSSQGMGILFPNKPSEEAFIVYKVDAPAGGGGDITAFTYGGRLSNRSPKSHIDFLHSFDNGKTWHKDYSLTESALPSDTIHFEKISNIPPGTRCVLFKYLLVPAPDDAGSCSLYSVHMEVNHKLPHIAPGLPGETPPLEVTFNWRESQKDYSFIHRSHTQLVEKFPTTYQIIVGGEDHPVVDSLTLNIKGAGAAGTTYGYSDTTTSVTTTSAPASAPAPAPATKWIGTWATYGNNLAFHKPYTLSIPSGNFWDSGDLRLKKLTDGVVGSSFSDGGKFPIAAAWNGNLHPEITVDLGEIQKCAAFRIHTLGWEPWDALKGQNKDRIEVLTSSDGKTFTSAGTFNCLLRLKDIPLNFMIPDDETLRGYNFLLPLQTPIEARFIRYKISTPRIIGVTEVQVLDSFSITPFDLKIALPDPNENGKPPPKPDLSPKK